MLASLSLPIPELLLRKKCSGTCWLIETQLIGSKFKTGLENNRVITYCPCWDAAVLRVTALSNILQTGQ